MRPDQTFFDIWKAPYGKRTWMMVIFNVCQTVGFYGFANWVPTLLVKQGMTLKRVCCIHRSLRFRRRWGR